MSNDSTKLPRDVALWYFSQENQAKLKAINEQYQRDIHALDARWQQMGKVEAVNAQRERDFKAAEGAGE